MPLTLGLNPLEEIVVGDIVIRFIPPDVARPFHKPRISIDAPKEIAIFRRAVQERQDG